MAKARHGHAERKPPGRVRRPDSSSRARERIAARRRAEVRRRILVAIASVTAVLAIVAGLVTVKLTSPNPVATESSAPRGLATQATNVPVTNQDVLAGAQYNPQVLAGLSASQIASQLRNPSSPAAKAIDGSANVIITAINQILHGTALRS